MASWTQRVVSTRAETVVAAWRRRSISPAGLLGLGALFLVFDALDQVAGDSFIPGAPLDEIAHLLTTLLVLWAIGGALWERMLGPALVASVAIDLDHVPARLGANWLTAGTPRPYTHSLLTVALVLAAGVAWPRRRELFLGLAAGLLIHFWRDLSEHGSSVSLLWPLTYHAFSLPHGSYLACMAAVFAAGMRRSALLARTASSPSV